MISLVFIFKLSFQKMKTLKKQGQMYDMAGGIQAHPVS